MAVSRSVLRSSRSLTLVVAAAALVGCEAGNDRRANEMLSEVAGAVEEARGVLSAAEATGPDAALLKAWVRLAEAYDLATGIVERYPNTHVADALARADGLHRVNGAASGSDEAPAREKLHAVALALLARAINEHTAVDAWEDACPEAPSDAWALVCVTAWVLSATSEAQVVHGEVVRPPRVRTRLDLSALVTHGHHRNALRHVRQLESEEVRRNALTGLTGALAWAHAAELALEAADTLAELGGSWGMAREAVVGAQAVLGDMEGVLATLDHLGPGVGTLRTRSAIAKALAGLDDALERRRVLDRVLPFISSHAREQFLGSVAVAVAQTGSIQPALEIADRIPDADVVETGRVLAGIAAAQAAAGDSAGARSLLRPATDMVAAVQSSARRDEARRVTTLGALAAAWIRAGDRETAFSLAGGVSSQDSLDILPPIARALSAEGDLSEALEIAASLVASTLAWEPRERGLAPFVARRTFLDIARDRMEAGDVAGALTAADRAGPHYMGARAFIHIVAEQARLGDHAGALATALRIPAEGRADHAIEALTIVALLFPESREVRNAIEDLQPTATPVALTMAYAALRDWHRSLAFAANLEEGERQETLRCILRMFGSSRDLGCLQQTDV